MQKQEQIFFVDEVLFSTRQSNTSYGWSPGPAWTKS